METAITLDEALKRAKPTLQAKIKHSVELLRKAEKLAFAYDDSGYWLGFSGGKDSQALYHVTQLAGVKFKAYFSPTSVDPPEVIRFVRTNYPDVQFTKLEKSIYKDFEERKCLPSMRIRWCCADFKEKGGANKVVLVGVRHEESVKRSKRKEVEVTGHKFSGDVDGFNQWRNKKLKRKDDNFDEFSEHSETMHRCISGKDKIVISPILDWTTKDVWHFLNDVIQAPHCELYDEGWRRIGCICCPMASPKDTLRDIKRWSHVKEKWIQAIRNVRRGGGIQKNPTVRQANKTREGGTDYLVNRGGWTKFLDSDNDSAVVVAEKESAQEREIAENIFDWWISKKPYKKWFSDKFQQQKLFEE